MKKLYSQQKQDQELTVAQIMNSLMQNSDLKKLCLWYTKYWLSCMFFISSNFQSVSQAS